MSSGAEGGPTVTRIRFAKTLVLVAVSAATACGGGGGDSGGVGPSPTPVVGSFTADMPNPVALAVAMLEGSKTGDLVTVEVTLTETSSVYGATFEVAYDGNKVEYDSWSPGTIFEQGGHTPYYLVDSITPSRLSVTATRQGNVAAVNVAGTKTMIKLRFRVLQAGSFRLDFQNYVLYDGSLVPAPINGIGWKGGALSGV